MGVSVVDVRWVCLWCMFGGCVCGGCEVGVSVVYVWWVCLWWM